jgi:xanthosine utilization system XapX-like protein
MLFGEPLYNGKLILQSRPSGLRASRWAHLLYKEGKMGKRTSRIFWIIFIILLSIGIIYTIINLFSPEYISGLVASYLSTLIGIILGIPIALEIERIKSNFEKQERKTKVLSVIIGELQFNRVIIENSWKNKESYEKGIFLGSILQDEIWKAISDGGELECIEDIDLLQKLSYAYHSIRELNELSRKLFELHNLPDQPLLSIKINTLNGYADSAAELALENIKSAEEAINKIRKNENIGPFKKKKK